MIDDYAALPTGLIMATSEACLYDKDGRMVASFSRVDEAHAAAALMTNAPALLAAAHAVIAWADADAAGRQALQGRADLSDALRQSDAAEARLRAVAKTLKGGVK